MKGADSATREAEPVTVHVLVDDSEVRNFWSTN